ncbi:MAG: hypothetical protein HY226_01000 [Candidatus Vogelbacteria bacterium]|nr:hypothetical protein [Candidatus Vogelbacteria bacterium]
MISWNRVFIDIMLFGAVILLPWWVATFMIVYEFFLFDNFFELIIFGLMFDMLYGVETFGTGNSHPIFFVIASVLYIILNKLKRYLRSYA